MLIRQRLANNYFRDRPPNKLLRIQERIKSRFSGGLVIDIQQPDYDLRYKII